MHVSEKGIKLIKEFEGLYLKAYYDAVGVITIGYGITNADQSITGTRIRKGLRISKETADAWLRKSLEKKYAPKVMKYYDKYHWNQNQFDALVSFAFNIGSIDGLTNNGKRSIETVAKKILEYDKAGGRRLRGLTRRRQAEHKLFCTPVANANTTKKVPNDTPKEEYDMPTIKEGSEGKAVKLWQVILDVTIDGKFGPQTEAATKAFQKKHELKEDGIVGGFTWSAGIGTL